MAGSPTDRDAILDAIAAWPREDQVALAETILRRAAAIEPAVPRRPSWRHMAGLATNGQQPPSDEEVAQRLDEHRSAKYG